MPSPRMMSSRVRNAAEFIRFGGLQTGEVRSTFEVVARGEIFWLRRYHASGRDGRTGRPLLLIPPLMLDADLYDVSPRASAVTTCSRGASTRG